jgi:hypothetical protein
MAVTEAQLRSAIDVAAAAASTAVTAQTSAERALEEIRRHVADIKAFEKMPRKVLHEIVREVQAEDRNLPAVVVEQPVALQPVAPPPDLTPVLQQLAALEASVAELQRKQARLVPLPNVSENRVKALEDVVGDLSKRVYTPPPLPIQSPGDVGDLSNRLSAVEDLVVEAVAAPKALSDHLRLMGEIMDAMDKRNKDMTELQRQAAEHAALAQGGLAAVVERCVSDVATLTSAVAAIRNQLAARDGFTQRIINRGR